MMTLTQANRVLVDPNRTYAQSAEAARVVGDHYRNLQLGGTAHTTDAYPKERHFFRDAARSRDDHKPDEDEEPKRRRPHPSAYGRSVASGTRHGLAAARNRRDHDHGWR